jgi:hypothetical protein
MGQDGEEVSLPLLVSDSGTAGQAQRLMPPQVKGNPRRPAQVLGRQRRHRRQRRDVLPFLLLYLRNVGDPRHSPKYSTTTTAPTTNS